MNRREVAVGEVEIVTHQILGDALFAIYVVIQ
jgi:hypothetical protein